MLASSAKKTIRLKVDAELKQQASELFASYGVTLTTAITIFLRQSVVEGGIPFKVADPFWSEHNQSVLAESIRELTDGRGPERDPSVTKGDASEPCPHPVRVLADR